MSDQPNPWDHPDVQDYINDLLANAGDEYDDDVAASEIALRYMRDLEARALTAAGPAPTDLVEGDILKRALTFYNRGEGLSRADILNMAAELTRLRKRVRVVAADPAPTDQQP